MLSVLQGSPQSEAQYSLTQASSRGPKALSPLSGGRLHQPHEHQVNSSPTQRWSPMFPFNPPHFLGQTLVDLLCGVGGVT